LKRFEGININSITLKLYIYLHLETQQEYEPIVEKYDTLSRRVQEHINNYFRFINCFNNLRDDISKFCYQEFNICINITLEEDQSQENENREFIYN